MMRAPFNMLRLTFPGAGKVGALLRAGMGDAPIASHLPPSHSRLRGGVRVLVATDLAARGIDVPGISHVINYELPNEPESYVHRIGRTARAGAGGAALSFCDQSEQSYLRAIESVMRRKVTVLEHRCAERPAEGAPLPKSQRQQSSRAPAAAKRGRRSRGRGFPGLPGGVPKFAKRERAFGHLGEPR